MMRGSGVLLLLASVLLGGCSVHWGNGDRAAARRPAKRPAVRPQRGQLDAQLQAMLRVVEQRLATSDDESASQRQALRAERLRIVVALTERRRANANERARRHVDVDDALMDAAERIDAARRRRTRSPGRGRPAPLLELGAKLRDKSIAPEEPEPEPETIGGEDGDWRDKKHKQRKRGKSTGKRGPRYSDDPLAGLDGIGKPGGPAPDHAPAPQAAVVADSGPPPDVWPMVESKLEEVNACLTPAERDAGVAFEVRARIAADGGFRRVRVRAEPRLPADTVSCVADVLMQIKVEPTGVSRVVTIPLSATPR